MTRGGKRPGAGRKRGFAAKSAEEARKLLSERLNQEIGLIADILVSKAKDGDMQAIKELFDRAWGRSPQSTRIDSGEQPIVLQLVNYRDLPNDELERIAATTETA